MKMRQFGIYLRVAGSLLPVVLSTSALAQERPPSNAAEVGGSETELQEIFVTATRQSQSINRVPISISAFTEQDLEQVGAKSIADVVRYTPGITISPDTNNIVIRGISSNAGAGTTGIYVDDTPIQIRDLSFNSNDSLPAIFDLDRVEVLRGPQGTLFGAGSEGGTVRYITAQPSLTNQTGYMRAEVSQVDHGGVSDEIGAAIGGPIVSDILGYRVSAFYQHLGGWVDQVDSWTGITTQRNANFSDMMTFSVALAWAPVDGLLITPSVRFQRKTDNNDASYTVGASDPSNGLFAEKSPEQHYQDDRFTLSSLNAKYDMGRFQLISNTAYYNRTDQTGYDGTIYDLQYWDQLLRSPSCAAICNQSLYPLLTATGINPNIPQFISPAPSYIAQKDLTQEIRLQTTDPNARITGAVGLFFETADQSRVSWIDNPRGTQVIPAIFNQSFEDFYGGPQILGTKDFYIDVWSNDRQIAGFADMTVRVVGGLKLEGGFRYADTKFSFRSFSNGALNGGVNTSQGNSGAKPFTPKLNATYEFDSNNLVYFTWSHGFRAGGANQTVPVSVCAGDLANLGLSGSPDQYQPDKVTNWEVGEKSTLFDNRLTIAASAFDMIWKGIQQSVYLPTCGFQFTANVGAARSTGFDLQIAGVPMTGLTLQAAIGYVKARYTETTSAGPTAVIAEDGNSLGTPPWTVSVGAKYDFNLLGHQNFLRADYQYASKDNTLTPATDPRTSSYVNGNIAPSSTRYTDMRLGSLFGDLTVSLFVNNLFDTAPRLSRAVNVADAYVVDQTWRPRSFGVTANKKF